MVDLLKGKTAVITGAGRGIGQATAILFSKEGAGVFITDIDKGPLDETISKIKSFGRNAAGISGDITKESDVKNIMKKAAELGNGSIDILINNAGITRDRILHQMTLDDWNFILNVNLTGSFLCIQAVSPYMREVAKLEEKSGKIKPRSIVNLSSTSRTGNIGQANYGASKAGIIGLTKTIAKEWARFNIRCNAVAPGFIETRLTQVRKEGEDFGIPEKQKQMITILQKETGLNRGPGLPEDIANALLFFGSDLSSYITGQVLTVSGGMIGTV